MEGGAAADRQIKTLAELQSISATVDRDTPFPPAGMRARRGKRSGTQKVTLPPDWIQLRG